MKRQPKTNVVLSEHNAAVDAAREAEIEEAKVKHWEDLTDRERNFVLEYCQCFNATEAAKRAGYTTNCAGQVGYDTLKKTYIRQFVNERLEMYRKGNADQVAADVSLLEAVRDFDPACIFDESNDVLPVNQWPEKARMVLSGLEVTVMASIKDPDDAKAAIAQILKRKAKFLDKLKAVELHMKYHGVLQPDTAPSPGITVNIALVSEMVDDILNGRTRMK